jgi:hypothetical protein
VISVFAAPPTNNYIALAIAIAVAVLLVLVLVFPEKF